MGPPLVLQAVSEGTITKVQDTTLEPFTTREVAPNELITLGSVMMVIQRRAHSTSRRIWSYGYFEARLEEECLRAERSKHPFALLRVECSPEVAAAELEERISKALRLVDAVGSYGPGVYQVLLSETGNDDARRVGERLRSRIQEVSPVRMGLSCYPQDGRSADELSARVGELLHGDKDHSGEGTHLSASMGHLEALVARVAASTINVLILGETGVGKEHFAQEVHRLSPRAARPFLGLNGAALSESLLESELFGHERGAFTGAVQAKPGLLEAAEGGTLFLDEVGELPMSIQAKLLRVLETRQVLRVGSVKPRPIDVRFVAATNADLESQVAQGRFRQDLFFRLNGVLLVVPPLRERMTEFRGMVQVLLSDACRKFGRAVVPTVSEDALELMMRYRWPGNIRELRNMVERAVVICDEKVIELRHLPEEKLRSTFTGGAAPVTPRHSVALPVAVQPAPRTESAARSEPAPKEPPKGPAAEQKPRTREQLQEELKGVERQRIVDALAECVGNQTRAAQVLGISRRTLVNRMNELGISGPRRRRNVPRPGA
jgi:DNA-binding NtrC family response regulator